MMTLAAAFILAMGAAAHGDNVGMGGPDGNYASLAERIANIEKKNDAFNVYFNYAASAQATYDGHTWSSKLANNSLISKVNWQFVPRWNFMAKGTYETASVSKIEQLKDYRKSIGYLASLEYYPVKDQDLRLFLAYVGHHYDFSRKCGLEDYSTSRIELGFMYRIKCF